uniref:Uncharacterized protein n=1 Tax=Oryza sativa subsp. japonica TaxID=39947 RepID=Q339M1_ORYSJ|nr:hypothetical protein LOC_Os10g20360 [Oryza sativa Japonica Group]
MATTSDILECDYWRVSPSATWAVHGGLYNSGLSSTPSKSLECTSLNQDFWLISQKGCTRNWFPYEEFEGYELPSDFNLNNINSDEASREIFITAITPCILQTGISMGHHSHISYEFYHPLVVAHQLGFGQVPIKVYFIKKIQTRGTITSALKCDCLPNLNGPNLGPFIDWDSRTIGSRPWIKWWGEWKRHLFNLQSTTSSLYLILNSFLMMLRCPSHILLTSRGYEGADTKSED